MRVLVFLIVTGSVLMATDLGAQNVEFKSDALSIAIDQKGRIVSLANPLTYKEYLGGNSRQPLLTVRKIDSEALIKPEGLTASRRGDSSLLKLIYPQGLYVEIEVIENPTHLRFTLLSVNQNDIVEAVIWGPFHTKLPEAVATALGIVRDDTYSIGMLGLNIKTLVGFEASGRCRFGNAVKHNGRGSMLQAFSIDRTQKRIGQSNIVAPAIPGEAVTGSSIALYGCNREEELEIIGEIEIAENLPHPVIDGIWVKKLPRKYHSKILTAFSEENIEQCIDFAQKANIHVVRMKNLYESWGHYKINKTYFPNGLEGLKMCVDKARAADVILGSHLRLHLHPNDPYVSPKAHPHLAINGETTTGTDISTETTEIILADDEAVKFYRIPKNLPKGKTISDWPTYVRIGTEIISYKGVSDTRPYRLLNCKRGVHNTTIMAHPKGTPVGKLVTVTRKKVFFPDAVLAKEMAQNLADLVNATGLAHLEMDGFDADDGHFQYARKVFMKTLIDKLDNKNILHGASDLLPYHWHYVGLISWGESRTTFRGSMLDYRLKVAEYLRSNHIPIGIGQYKLDKLECIEDMEWLCARAAGNDAGWDLYLSVAGFENHRLRDQILDVMNNWQTAYMEDVFTPEQKEMLQDVTREFKLSKTEEGEWKLTQTGTWKPAFSGTDLGGGVTPGRLHNK
jgi:hypothetical protein